jgi:hypothetical protein
MNAVKIIQDWIADARAEIAAGNDVLMGRTLPPPFIKRLSGSSRPAYARLQNVLVVLRAGKECNCRKLAGAAKTSTKTIHLDICFLRAQGFRIEYDRAHWTYRLDPSCRHPWLEAT